MSIFEKKNYIGRRAFRQILRGDSGSIPGSGRRFTKKERVAFESEVFGKKHGSLIFKRDYQGALRDLARQKRQAKTSAEKWALKRKSIYLGKFVRPREPQA